jgi:hypothetical protein
MNEDISSRQGIDISDGEKLNPIQGLDMHKVMLYLDSLSKRAEKGSDEAAREVFWIALRATIELEGIVAKRPGFLQGLPLNNVPVVMGDTGIREGKDIQLWAKKYCATWERKMRRDANPKVRDFVEGIAAELNRIRTFGGDDSRNSQVVPILEVLSVKGWRPGPGGKKLKGWRQAAKFLPPPSESDALIWWAVAEARLAEEFSTKECPQWFQHPRIAEVCGPLKKYGIVDTDRARGAFRKAIRDRFLEAVQRIPV